MHQTTNAAAFVDFKLQLDENPPETVTIAANLSPQGQADATVPYQEVALLEASPTTELEAKEFGRRLMDVLFRNEIRHLYERSLGAGHRLRILISLPFESRLHRLPFELLHDGKRHLARDDRTVLVRSLRVKEPMKAPGIDAPLRMLFTTACPSGYEPLKLRAEEDAVREALLPFGNDVKLTVLRNVTFEKLDKEYRGAKNNGSPFHIWHHGGHGSLGVENDFHLVLHDNTKIPSTRLHELISQNPALRLAVINTCHSGSPYGLATMLARLEVPSAIGTASALYDSIAIDFAEAFYPSLRRLSVEEAVSQARSRLQRNACPLAWSKTLLFSRYRRVGPILLPRKRDPEGPPPENWTGRTDSEVSAAKAKDFRHQTTSGKTCTEAKEIEGCHSSHSLREKSE